VHQDMRCEDEMSVGEPHLALMGWSMTDVFAQIKVLQLSLHERSG